MRACYWRSREHSSREFFRCSRDVAIEAVRAETEGNEVAVLIESSPHKELIAQMIRDYLRLGPCISRW